SKLYRTSQKLEWFFTLSSSISYVVILYLCTQPTIISQPYFDCTFDVTLSLLYFGFLRSIRAESTLCKIIPLSTNAIPIKELSLGIGAPRNNNSPNNAKTTAPVTVASTPANL